MSLLPELDYSITLPTDSIIESRTDVVLSSPSTSHSYKNNHIIRLNIAGSGFVDPLSISLYADVFVSAPNTTAANFSMTKTDRVIVPSTYEMFDSIRILDGYGNVLEELNEAALLSQKLHEASSNSDFLDCSYGFTNSQKDLSKRQTLSNVNSDTNKETFRIAALDIVGLFSQEKLIHLPTFKGLQIEMRMISNENAFTSKAAGDATGAEYKLMNVKLHYTEIQASRGYMNEYNKKIKDGGYALNFRTCSSVIRS